MCLTALLVKNSSLVLTDNMLDCSSCKNSSVWSNKMMLLGSCFQLGAVISGKPGSDVSPIWKHRVCMILTAKSWLHCSCGWPAVTLKSCPSQLLQYMWRLFCALRHDNAFAGCHHSCCNTFEGCSAWWPAWSASPSLLLSPGTEIDLYALARRAVCVIQSMRPT